MVADGAGGLSINLVHLPHPGGIYDQSKILLDAFDVIKNALYSKHLAEMKRANTR